MIFWDFKEGHPLPKANSNNMGVWGKKKKKKKEEEEEEGSKPKPWVILGILTSLQFLFYSWQK
jgi:hypothetical protein